MESKKPRLELYESDYETDSDTSSSSVSSFLALSSSLPSLSTLASPVTISNASPNLPSQVPSLANSNAPPFTNPNVQHFTATKNQPAAQKMPPPVISNVPLSATSNANMSSPSTSKMRTLSTATMPSSSATNMPSTSAVNMPSTSAVNMPSTSTAKMPSTSTAKMPSTLAINMPSTSAVNMPSTSTAKMPSTSTAKMPSSSTAKMPSTSAVNMPSTSTAKMPSSSSANMPSTSTCHLPPAPEGAARNTEQLRASFRSACEEIDHDIAKHPTRSKQEIFDAIEDYLVVLSGKATQPFNLALSDDSHSIKISLKVDKNKVSVYTQTTPNQAGQGEDVLQSEGAASSRSSRVIPGCGGAYWMPPVNPFTSSVTLRQHLEAASNSVRPRRLRPPPGFHPTPQYNANIGVPTPGAAGQTSSSGVVRPPPGFHGIAGHASSQVQGTGSSNILSREYCELLDTQAIIADLYRQSLSVLRQNSAMATSQLTPNNLYTAGTQDQLLYSMIPRHPDLQGRPSSSSPRLSHEGHREPRPATPAPSARQYDDLWQHFNNAAAAAAPSRSYIDEGGPGYWDDFLLNEVYDNFMSDQNSVLWKQFEDYMRIHYAPGSLRTGTTIFTSENTGAAKHGPVGYRRPTAQNQNQTLQPLENISIRRNVEQVPLPNQHPQELGQQQQEQQQPPQPQREILTLSDRFKNAAAISNPQHVRLQRSPLPQTRNEMLGALLHDRLMERAAGIFLATTSTNTRMNFAATASSAPCNSNMNMNTVGAGAGAAGSGTSGCAGSGTSACAGIGGGVATATPAAAGTGAGAGAGAAAGTGAGAGAAAGTGAGAAAGTGTVTDIGAAAGAGASASAGASAGASSRADPGAGGGTIPRRAGGTSNNMNNTMNTATATLSLRMDQMPCSYCIENNETAAAYPTHVLRDGQGRTVCPILRNKRCPICNKKGDKAHTVHECPIRLQWDREANAGARAGAGADDGQI